MWRISNAIKREIENTATLQKVGYTLQDATHQCNVLIHIPFPSPKVRHETEQIRPNLAGYLNNSMMRDNRRRTLMASVRTAGGCLVGSLCAPPPPKIETGTAL